ncbi:hypothetical protein [Pseudomonas petrae]|uniref:Uncharacterized protein n=1 Tax=Pseudomonas petrae TaxID=2912190 RepID=A0ABS9IA99_9PSED|nr:hypothetical protein [Pseudomonas petrae]MCF7544662.1 hypothetical protein [Pseudomonas petrae]
MSGTSTKTLNILANALARSVNKQKRDKKTRAGVLALAAPVPPDWWNGDTNFAGLVPREDQEKDMTILIAKWDNSALDNEIDTLLFQWRPLNSGNWQPAQNAISLPGPLDPSQFPMPLTLNKSNFATEGTFELRYQVTIDVGTTTDSDTATFIIDKTPPNNNQSPTAPTFPDPIVVSDGITQEYLTTNGGVLIEIPIYQDQRLGDSLQIYVHNAGTSPTNPIYEGEMDGNRQIKIPSAAFAGLRDGLIYVSYRLVDKVGNLGGGSNNATAGLFIEPLPDVLAAPTVPIIKGDNVLNLDDVLLGTSSLVEIEPYKNALEGDTVVLTWGTATHKVRHVVSDVLDKIVLNVGYENTLAPAYGAATGVLPTTVSYVVERGNKTFPSDTATIDVDFFVPGPENPDRPDPINVNLPRVKVRGTGANPEDDVLNEDDAGLPVEVTVDLYAPIGPDEEMILYWAAVENDVGTFSPVQGTPGDPYTFTVPWDRIKDLPSGIAVPVFYTVGRADGTGNVESCVPTLVDVSAALPIKLSEPEFPDAGVASDGSLILNCTSFIGPDQLVNVRIPPNTLLKGGETLSFEWQCYTDKLGQSPAGTLQEFDKLITADQAANGFEFTVRPFADYIVPVGRNGSVTLKYVSDTTPPMQGEVLIRAAAQDAAGVCTPNPRVGLRSGGCGC